MTPREALISRLTSYAAERGLPPLDPPGMPAPPEPLPDPKPQRPRSYTLREAILSRLTSYAEERGLPQLDLPGLADEQEQR